MSVSVITINFNTSAKTIALLESVRQFSPDCEVIVVDNCSRLDDYQLLLDYCSARADIRLLRNRINAGFGAGNMLACVFASQPYLAFINNDVVLLEDSLSILKEFMDTDAGIAVATAQQLAPNGKPVKSFDYFHGIRKTLLGRWSVELFREASVRRSRAHFDHPIEVDFIQGSFMFFRAAAFYRCGGFDTNLFLYCEEMDICYRLKQLGLKSYFNPATRFQHESGGSTLASFASKTEPKLSFLYLARKHHGYPKYLLLKYGLLLQFLLKGLRNPRYFALAWDIWSEKILQRSLRHRQGVDLQAETNSGENLSA